MIIVSKVKIKYYVCIQNTKKHAEKYPAQESEKNNETKKDDIKKQITQHSFLIRDDNSLLFRFFLLVFLPRCSGGDLSDPYFPDMLRDDFIFSTLTFYETLPTRPSRM